MAPNISAWAHPYTSPFICYADGGDEGAAPDTAPAVEVEPEEEPVDDWTPPTREEYEATVAKLKTASGEAAARRKYLRQHGIDPKTGEKAQRDETEATEAAGEEGQQSGPSAAEIKRQVDKAAAEAELRGLRKTKALVTGVNTALAEAGWNGQRLNSLMKLIDLDDVDIDDGEITGLSEQIDAIKAEWPEFFKRNRQVATSSNGAGGSGQNGVPAVKVEAADKPAPRPEPKGWADVLAERAMRG